MSAYADASFLVSLYWPDANSTRAAGMMAAMGFPVLITSLGELELANALQLLVFRKESHPSEAAPAHETYLRDVEAGVFALNPMDGAVYASAHRISRNHTSRLGTRTLDILHVAAARVLGADAFLSFDARQKRLAQAEGLRTP